MANKNNRYSTYKYYAMQDAKNKRALDEIKRKQIESRIAEEKNGIMEIRRLPPCSPENKISYWTGAFKKAITLVGAAILGAVGLAGCLNDHTEHTPDTEKPQIKNFEAILNETNEKVIDCDLHVTDDRELGNIGLSVLQSGHEIKNVSLNPNGNEFKQPIKIDLSDAAYLPGKLTIELHAGDKAGNSNFSAASIFMPNHPPEIDLRAEKIDNWTYNLKLNISDKDTSLNPYSKVERYIINNETNEVVASGTYLKISDIPPLGELNPGTYKILVKAYDTLDDAITSEKSIIITIPPKHIDQPPLIENITSSLEWKLLNITAAYKDNDSKVKNVVLELYADQPDNKTLIERKVIQTDDLQGIVNGSFNLSRYIGPVKLITYAVDVEGNESSHLEQIINITDGAPWVRSVGYKGNLRIYVNASDDGGLYYALIKLLNATTYREFGESRVDLNGEKDADISVVTQWYGQPAFIVEYHIHDNLNQETVGRFYIDNPNM